MGITTATIETKHTLAQTVCWMVMTASAWKEPQLQSLAHGATVSLSSTLAAYAMITPPRASPCDEPHYETAHRNLFPNSLCAFLRTT